MLVVMLLQIVHVCQAGGLAAVIQEAFHVTDGSRQFCPESAHSASVQNEKKKEKKVTLACTK